MGRLGGTNAAAEAQAKDYAFVIYDHDMTVGLLKNGQQIAKVTQQELRAARQTGDTQEQTYARALAIRRMGARSIEEAKRYLAPRPDR